MSETETTHGIPNQHRVSEYGDAEYGRPRYVLHYYSQRINARARKTFSTRHEAVGVLATLEREGVTDHPRVSPELEFEGTY